MEYTDAQLSINGFNSYVAMMIFVVVSENVALLLSRGFENLNCF
jgi:hypothetical protein